MTKRYWTAVFEVNEAFEKSNPFAETIWGKPVCVSIGDAQHEKDLYETALEEIRDGYCSMCAEIADNALREAHSYVNTQFTQRPKASAKPEVQLDLEECIAAKAGGK